MSLKDLRPTKYMRARKREKDAMKANGQIGPNARARTAAVSMGKEMNPHGMMPRTVSMMNQEKIGLAKMGMKKPTVEKGDDAPASMVVSEDREPDFATPDYGPPRQDFWHDPSDPSTNITGKFCVVRVDSPNAFWIQNLAQKEEFHTLEKKMKEWYDNYWEADPRGLRHRDIKLGGFYAAYLQDYEEWTRVRVVEIAYGKEQDYHVYLLDYGYQRVVSLDCLMFLRHTYNELPIQAVKAETCYEGSSIFTSEEKAQFDKDIGGKEIDVLPLSCREEEDTVYKILRVLLITRPITSEMEKFSPSDFYNLNGRLRLDQTIESINKFQSAILNKQEPTTK